MLIVAMPKSGSTALVETIAELHQKNDASQVWLDNFYTKDRFIVPEAFPRMQRMHQQVVEYTEDEIDELVLDTQNFYKIHIPPTSTHLEYLKDKKYVVLLRKPEDVIAAYYRGDKSGVHPVRSIDFLCCFSEKSWKRRAKKNGYFAELEYFNTMWEAQNHACVVYYEELVKDPTACIQKIEAYFGLPVSEDHIQLKKARYSRKENLSVFSRFKNHVVLLLRYIKWNYIYVS